jgi:hypothetical protein
VLTCHDTIHEDVPRRVSLSFYLACAALTIQAASPTDWKQGKLLDLAVSMTPLPNGKPASRKVYAYSGDGGDRVYEAQEVGRKAPHVEVNSPITYSASRDYLFIKDSDGKVHKLAMRKTTRKE